MSILLSFPFIIMIKWLFSVNNIISIIYNDRVSKKKKGSKSVNVFVLRLTPQCETIVEQNEDEIIEFFSHETDNVKDKLCSKRTGQNSLLHLY